MLGIVSSFFPALIRIFDVYFWLSRVLEWIANKPFVKLRINQSQLNFVTELIEFEPGYDSIPIINSFLFTCFFASLQPIIIVFALTGMILMFWTQKYSIFNRCRRPSAGNRTINRAMYPLIYLGPLFYSLGSFTWSSFYRLNNDTFVDIAPNLVAAIVSFILFLLPYGIIVKCLMGKQYHKNETYESNRIYFPS